MNDKQRQDPHDSLMDTQRLLLGAETPEEGSFSLEDIMAEYGRLVEKPAAPQAELTPEVPQKMNTQGSRSKTILFPSPAGLVAEEETQDSDTVILRPDNDLDAISPEALFGLPVTQRTSPHLTEEIPDEGEDTFEAEADDGFDDSEEAVEPAPDFVPLTMEDIVASTVDAVKVEQQKKSEKLLKKLEKERKKAAAKAPKRREPAMRTPVPEVENEPACAESSSRHKRRHLSYKKGLLCALPVLLVLWLPWILTQVGMTVPFFSGGAGNVSMCVLIPQAVICILCWPVIQTAIDGLREGTVSFCALVSVCNIVTFLDEITLLLLPQRTEVAPLGGVAAVGMVFALWGLTSYHRGMWETFRTAALGEPGYLTDFCESGVVKGRGKRHGFTTRVNMEDTSSQWQRLIVPALLIATLVFALLSSVGQGRGQNFLWCWSAILCMTCSLVFPLAYCVPFGLLAVRLSRSGAAVAGQYGAAALAASRQIVVTDTDLFPHGTVALNGLKLYGEERDHAISYTATLVVQGGGCLGRVFDDICRGEQIPYQPLEHFHIHDDCGLSGIIHGETVLVGSPTFMRHKAVKLPASMPSKTCVCLAVDGALTAVFAVKYNTSELVENAMRALSRNGLQVTLAVRDGNITPKLLKTRFGTDGSASYPELSDRVNLSDPEREAGSPNGLLYREGLAPFVELVAGSRRLCHMVRIGNLLSLLGSVFGALLGFYLTFAGNHVVLTPVLTITYLLLWVVPVLPLLWGIDKT